MRPLPLPLLLLALAGPAAAGELPPGVELVAGSFVPGSQPDGNSLVFDAPGGLVVVDTGRHPEHTRKILDLAAARGQAIAVVVNSHWHLDHIGGNPRVRAAFPGVKVVASTALEGAMTGFLANYRKQLEGLVAKAETEEAKQTFLGELAILDAGPALAPDETVTASGPRTLAGRPFDVHLESRAVTAGDLWLFDPATRVLVAGDLVTLPAPFFDTACPSRWQEALGRLAEVDFAVLVPGHGAPLDRQAFAAYRRAFDRLLACAAASDKSKETCVDGWIADAGALVPESDRGLARGLIDYYLDAVLRADPTRLCGE